MSKATFISTTNIFDDAGNGGVKASREHYNILCQAFGKDNVQIILFVHNTDHYDFSKYSGKNRIKIYKRTEGNVKLLLAALFGCRVYMPWEEKKIIKNIDSYDPNLIFLDFSVAGRLMRKFSSYRTICYFHNVESDYTLNKMKTDGIRYFPAYWAAKRNDKWALKADYIMCFNGRDSARLEQLYGRKADYIFPISLPDRFKEECCITKYEKRLLFLGSCFGPNQDGIEWFIQEVMPQLADEGILLDIVGLGFEEKKDFYSQYRNVNVIGTVDKTDDYYYSHAIVVMPIRYGAGMKVKTAEAMMFGRYIVASDEALEGYSVIGVDDIKRCNKADEYISTILELFKTKNFSSFSRETRTLYTDNYDTSSVQKSFANTLETITNGA